MKAILTVEDFNRLITCVKDFTKRINGNALEWIKLEFADSTVTAIANDGYKMAVETASCAELDVAFDALLRPDIKKVPKSSLFVEIELKDEVLYISHLDYIIGYKQPIGIQYPDYKKIYEDICKDEVNYEIMFNGQQLLPALKSADISGKGKYINSPLLLKFRGPEKPLVIETNNGYRLVCPLRRGGKCDNSQ